MSFPIQLTVMRIVLVPIFYVLLAAVEPQQALWASVVFAIAAASDWWDGHMARSMNLTSALGAFLDPLADKLLTSAAFVAFAVRGYVPWWMVLLVISRDVYLTILRIIADNIGREVRTSYFAKVKTFIQMVFIGVVLFLVVAVKGTFGQAIGSVARSITFSGSLFWVMGAVTLITVVSAGHYSYDNFSVLRSALRRYVFRQSPQKSH